MVSIRAELTDDVFLLTQDYLEPVVNRPMLDGDADQLILN
jgi:hypothetical protein